MEVVQPSEALSETLEDAVARLEALGNPTRLSIYRLLVRAGAGGLPVGRLWRRLVAERGLSFIVFEQGEGPDAAMAEWRHVTFFSPWRFNVDGAAERLLSRTGWVRPEAERDPTGRELIENYLNPLAALPQIAPHV